MFFQLAKKGNILIITALLAVFFLGLLAIVIDIGYAYYEQNKLFFAIKAASEAGNNIYINYQKNNNSKELSNEQIKKIDDHIREILALNITKQFANNAEIVISNGKIIISAKHKIGLFFARAINLNSLEIYVSNKNLL